MTPSMTLAFWRCLIGLVDVVEVGAILLPACGLCLASLLLCFPEAARRRRGGRENAAAIDHA